LTQMILTTIPYVEMCIIAMYGIAKVAISLLSQITSLGGI
jgi:hypothetical protein